MPSFGYGVAGATPYRRLRLVSFSQNTRVGAVPSGAFPATSSRVPRNGCSTRADVAPAAVMTGLEAPRSQDQVLRNHAVGSTCRVSVSGPALVTVTAMSTSVGSAFA